MSRIKYTIVPKDNYEASIFESGVRLTESVPVIDPIIIFNSNMELGIEQDIYGNNIEEDSFKFAREEDLIATINEYKDKELCSTIIINGFDIDLDFIRDNIFSIANESEKTFSINVISDSRKYTNFTINITSDLAAKLTDEEWEEYKEDYNISFEKSLKQDTFDNRIRNKSDEDEAVKAVRDLIKALYDVDDDAIEEVEETETENLEDADEVITISLDDLLKGKSGNAKKINTVENKLVPVSNKVKKGRYEAYSYATDKALITIERDGDELIILDEGDNEVIVPVSFMDFIIETLNKLK